MKAEYWIALDAIGIMINVMLLANFGFHPVPVLLLVLFAVTGTFHVLAHKIAEETSKDK